MKYRRSFKKSRGKYRGRKRGRSLRYYKVARGGTRF